MIAIIGGLKFSNEILSELNGKPRLAAEIPTNLFRFNIGFSDIAFI